MLCDAIHPRTREDCFTSHDMVGQRKKKRQPGEIVQEELAPRICTIFRQEELLTRIPTNFQLEEEYFKFKGSWYIYKYIYI